ncbi:hypothetical protein FRC04_001149 [Tulasnella sp. 424]|nr:hypothetical protein FRC04_001149 [Tulasnella sp. 424]
MDDEFQKGRHPHDAIHFCKAGGANNGDLWEVWVRKRIISLLGTSNPNSQETVYRLEGTSSRRICVLHSLDSDVRWVGSSAHTSTMAYLDNRRRFCVPPQPHRVRPPMDQSPWRGHGRRDSISD